MHCTEVILVHVPEAVAEAGKERKEMTETEVKNCVITYAENTLENFCPNEIDYYNLLEEDEDEYFPKPVIFANQDWEQFTSYLDNCDRGQKAEASFLLEYLEEQTGTTDVSEILTDLLLSRNRRATADEVDEKTWRYDFLNQGAFALKQISHLIKGTFMFESMFYDSFRGTALVPFYDNLKETPEREC